MDRIAFSNMKYHKSKNILIGIAIFLTTLLLFLVPTIGIDLINGQKAAINELYPTWHAFFEEDGTCKHYPVTATIIMAAVLVCVQLILTFAIQKSVKKDSLIDRIRFDN